MAHWMDGMGSVVTKHMLLVEICARGDLKALKAILWTHECPDCGPDGWVRCARPDLCDAAAEACNDSVLDFLLNEGRDVFSATARAMPHKVNDWCIVACRNGWLAGVKLFKDLGATAHCAEGAAYHSHLDILRCVLTEEPYRSSDFPDGIDQFWADVMPQVLVSGDQACIRLVFDIFVEHGEYFQIRTHLEDFFDVGMRPALLRCSHTLLIKSCIRDLMKHIDVKYGLVALSRLQDVETWLMTICL